jgi:hypothetical protein
MNYWKNYLKYQIKNENQIKIQNQIKNENQIKIQNQIKNQNQIQNQNEIKNEINHVNQYLNYIPNLGTETELELYIPFSGGDSSEIWPIISENWKKEHKLGIRSKTNPRINFEFILNHLGKIDEPILGRGTFTAVYQLRNISNTYDTTKYILRLYMRDSSISDKHMNHNEKIKNEYNIFSQYMIKNYYFGELKIKDNQFNYDSKKDIYNIIPNTLKNYNFDYVITKVYETPKFDKFGYVTGLTNKQKFKFLYENVLMLYELELNNSFHADYKIANVGYEDSNKMNVIAIDYDIATIQPVTYTNPKMKENKNGIVIGISFPSTYIPEYLKDGKGIKAIHLEKYIKYSVGGLYNIFKVLNIQYSFNTIQYNLNHRNIYVLNSKDIGYSLHLTNPNYDLIPSYYEIINALLFLRQYVL